MTCALTALLVGCGMFVLIGDQGGLDLQRMAGTWIGAAIGYWFK